MTRFNIKTILLLAIASFVFAGCSEEELNSESVLTKVPEYNTEFDQWLKANYVEPYNIQFYYRYNDKESNLSYNVIPAQEDKARGLAILVKQMWVDAYVEALGADFMKKYSPRIIQLTGSHMYSANGEVVLGTAEGGLKVMLYGVNSIDLDNALVNSDNPYAERNSIPLDLNYWFFHTMHHEFCHILTQKKEYDTSFRTISAGKFHATDWINQKDKTVAKEGFVSAYASGEYNEDFAELYSTYVTLSETGWNKIIKQAGDDGAAIINKKIDIVKKYFKTSWNLDIDDMRAIIQRRSAEVPSLDLRTLK